MMKSRLLFWTVGLVAVLVAVSCAPAETAPLVLAPTVVSIPATAAPSINAPEAPTQIAEVQAVPTSRGPDLHATDPATVSLASGGLQLVEFFRFT
ncbi:MAG: hypothetical protein Q8L87_08825 [Anaerolineales bacterium]|nr:hypothetical protein [Anaerolineales bacterium]